MKKLAIALLLVLFVPVLASAQTFNETVVATGIAAPVAMQFMPDGRLLVAEQAGKLRVIKNGTLQATPMISLTVASNSERGLLGIAIDPNFATNKYVYLYYTRATPEIKNRLSRFTISSTNPDILDPSTEKILIDNIASDAGNHNGGAIHFGKDGKLYVATGDGGRFTGNSQALNSLSGKILRINSDGTPPADNPFYNVPGSLKEIWAYGFRNPFTFAVNPVNGEIYVNDVGQNTWEEINLLEKGKDFGWPVCEGPKDTGFGFCTNLEMRYPIHAYGRTVGRAITGGVFFNGEYYFGDYVGAFIKKLKADKTVADVQNNTYGIVDLKVSPDNFLYYLTRASEGRVVKLTPKTAPINGQCAAVVNMCTAGTLRDTADSATNNLWSCVGVNGGTTASCSMPISTNRLPTATITTPAVNSKYNAGQSISFSGTATDPEDGTLPASAFSWSVVFHHDTHTHPFAGPIIGKTGDTITIPTSGEISTNVWYRIILTVTDSKGGKTEVSRDIYPNVVDLTFRTEPAGLRVIVDGQPQFTPYIVKSVVGMTRNINVADQQMDNDMYLFNSWSDNKPRNHDITTPAANTAYTAMLNVVRPQSISFIPNGSGDLAVNMQKEIDDRIAGVLAGLTTRSIWYTRGSNTAAWERNPNVFTNRVRAIDLSGQSPWNSTDQYKRSGTLVSPRHLIFAKHFPLVKDSTVVFVNSNNDIITRTVTKVEVSPTSDLGVALLDRDTPVSIPFYPVIPRATWEQYLKGIDGNTPIPIIYLNQNDRVGVHVVNASSFYNGSGNMRHAKGEGKRAEFDDPVISGDSGNPAFAVIGGQPVLLFTHFDIPFGPNLGTLFNEVNAIMARLGGGYQLSTVDLRDFTPAKPPTTTNRPPTARALDVEVTGLVTVINLEGSDPDGDPLTFGTGVPPVRGTLRKETETRYTYTLASLPDAAFVDGFNYYSADGKQTSPAMRVTLRYNPAQYNLLVTKTGLGTVTASNINCGLDCAEKYSINTNVTLTATPAAGHTFTGWSGECTGMTCTLAMTKDRAVTANFAVVNTAPVAQNGTYTFSGNSINVTLTASDSQNDPLTFTPNISAQAKGTLTKASNNVYTYTLKAPLPTTSFTETFTFTVSDGKLTSAPATITMQYNVAAPQKFNLTVSKTGNGTITGTGISCGNDCTESINAGSIVTLTATPATGHNFTRWTGACTNTVGACTVTMDRARTVNAIFTAAVDPDRDGDGILLPIDKCPNTPPNLRNQVNRSGCVRPKLTKFTTKPVVEDDITAIQNVELGINNVGKITFKEPVALTRETAVIDIDANVIIEQDKVEIKSAIVPELNKPATITLYNVDEKNPRILKDGVVCTEPQCKIESFIDGTLVFTVTGFSVYTIEETPVTPEPTPEEPRRRRGGGGGGSRTVAVQNNEALIAQLTAQLNLLIAQLNALTGGATAPAGGLTKNLFPGSRDPEVRVLQQLLNKKGIIVPTTGYYGAQTQAAVRKFQAQNGITQTGSVGPLTRGKLNQ